ncbi:signal transduction histidine kinase [Actinomadura pelletieri DSM 43383]|uniref:histidine kinase n=1 Tax=Actinomadura pelletieri DSM 43383 TaxID=1120940 RepID=A0A495QY77_9ACTN|nr:HAMP domain-containing sensor histidine kinase [Actinomadura pelletieri]RKS79017.1 signal transduction histidine kinase [Actinomadura pelletieri DSM 43383]
MATESPETVRRLLRRLFLSVRGRATVITVAVSALVLALVFVLLMLLARDWTRNNVWQESEQTVERVVSDITRGRGVESLDTGPDETDLVQVVGSDGRVVAASEAMRGRPALAADEVISGKVLVDETGCPDFLDGCVRLFGTRLAWSPWGANVMVVAASPLPTLVNVWLLPLGLMLTMTGLLALIAWWTWHTIGRAFVPIDAIRAEMADFGARGLGHRVPVPQTGGELQGLAETVNATLERLEEATERERRFVSDASHDLRNPLAGLQTRLEVALDEPDDFEWRPTIESALRDTRRLNEIIVDLLELSRLDARAPVPVERSDLGELVRREVGRRPSRVPISTDLEDGVTVRANTGRLIRVLGNLLSNAERHAEGRIEVTVARDGDDAVLEVLDDGVGVPEEARERVFERFSRLRESRDRDPQGTGLGLPIAREIAEIYGGTLRIADSPTGARFVLRLPIADSRRASVRDGG